MYCAEHFTKCVYSQVPIYRTSLHQRSRLSEVQGSCACIVYSLTQRVTLLKVIAPNTLMTWDMTVCRYWCCLQLYGTLSPSSLSCGILCSISVLYFRALFLGGHIEKCSLLLKPFCAGTGEGAAAGPVPPEGEGAALEGAGVCKRKGRNLTR